ncbi:DinB family protein [soil metagenome]
MASIQTGLSSEDRLRSEVVAVLKGGNAHGHPDKILADIPFEIVNERLDGLPYSLWDLVYHLWFTQHDILVFTVKPDYQEKSWPTEYWPAAEASPTSWDDTCKAFKSDLDRLVRLVESPATGLTDELEHAPGYTVLRQALLAASHNSHHLGQIIAVRRLLGLWK